VKGFKEGPKPEKSTAAPPSKIVSDSIRKLVQEHYTPEPSDDYLKPLALNGNEHACIVVHSAINRPDMQPAIYQLGLELDRIGVPKHDRPTFGPMALYGGMFGMFIANTHGLRDSDVREVRVLGEMQLNKLEQQYPGCKFLFRTSMLDTRIHESHPTLGKTAKPKGDERDLLGQAMHGQTQFVIETANGILVPFMTIEATGAANHPMGDHAEILPFSFEGHHKHAPTNVLPMRWATKDGQTDLRNLTPYMPSLQGQNTNAYYARRGEHAQQPEGLEYPHKLHMDLPLSRNAALKALAQFMLVEKGGQIVLEDDPISNPNKKYVGKFPSVGRLLSAGTLGQHAQSGGQLMCMSAALVQGFGPDGIAFLDKPQPFPNSFFKPDNTSGVATGLIFSNMANGAIMRDHKGNVVPPQNYESLLGRRVVESYRQSILNSGQEVGGTVFVSGYGTTVPVNMMGPGISMKADPETVNRLEQFLLSDRALADRYKSDHQAKDFGRRIDSSTPILPEERQAARDYIVETGKTFGLSARQIQECIDRLLK
jgi:hypothetical protein